MFTPKYNLIQLKPGEKKHFKQNISEERDIFH